jgi:flagellar hook-length control protein FliK
MLANTLPIVASQPAPAPQAGAAPRSDTADAEGSGSFAQALDQAQPPRPTPSKPSAAGKAAAARPGTEPSRPASDDRGPACEAAPPIEPELEGGTDAEGATEGAQTPHEVSALLADLRQRATPPRAGDPGTRHPPIVPGEGGGPTKAAPTAAAPVGTEAWRAALAPPRAEPPLAPGDRTGGPAAGPKADPAAADARSTLALAAAAGDAAAASNTTQRFDSLLAAATAAQTLNPTGPTAPANPGAALPAAAAEATIPAHPSSREFAPQIGAALSTFVREGIEHAQLHLHPAELGPVQVQIQIDGTQAQVLLGAEHALTRQALEASLPLLAGSLREAGLTLAGGGVFERQPGNDGGNGSNNGTPGSGRGTGLAEGTDAPAAPALPPRRRGVVDLVA